MEHAGDSIQAFMNTEEYKCMSAYHKACVIFDMIKQLVDPLATLHRTGFVHGDIKPDNICIRRRDHTVKKPVPWAMGQPMLPYESEYEFTLIDFGIISKFKVRKSYKVYNTHIGNLMFSSRRGLKCHQTRFQDDFESLMFLAYYFICGRLPWDIEFRRRLRLKHYN